MKKFIRNFFAFAVTTSALIFSPYTAAEDYSISKYSNAEYLVRIIEPAGLPLGCASARRSASPLIVISIIKGGHITLSIDRNYLNVKKNPDYSDVNISFGGERREIRRGLVSNKMITFNVSSSDINLIYKSVVNFNNYPMDVAEVDNLYKLTHDCFYNEIGLK